VHLLNVGDSMDSLQFAYWLQGFFELSENKELTQKQVQIIKDHLALIFTKVTPNTVPPDTRKLIYDDMGKSPLPSPNIVPFSTLDYKYCSAGGTNSHNPNLKVEC
jgi:hypothetical protein